MSTTALTVPRDRLTRLAAAAVATNVLIVFTGGLVRVTGSGLGCPTWPTCDGETVVPRPGGEHATWQTAIEFGNRLLTFLVLAVAVALLLEVRRRGRQMTPTNRRLAWALPAGVLAQALLGGVTVLTGLYPLVVAAHFLLSMVLIAIAVALYERAREASLPPKPPLRIAGLPPAGMRALTTAVCVVGGVVLVLGTLVTAAGPHAGDPETVRLGLDIRLIAITHADGVWLLLGLTVAVVALTWRSGPDDLRRAARALLVIELLQGAVGYTQYALGIPAALVSIHILGAALMWTVAVAVWVRARPAEASVTDAPATAPTSAPVDGLAATEDASPAARP